MNTPYNNHDNGFDKAQRAYDRMEPPECDEEEMEEDEHQSRKDALLDWEERKAEEAREEQRLELDKHPPHIDVLSDRYSGFGECRENE